MNTLTQRMIALSGLGLALMFCTPESASAQTTDATDWDAYLIKNAEVSGDSPAFNVSSGQMSATIDQGGQKVGYGTSAVDGLTLGDITGFEVDRIDEGSNLFAPYINIWVGDNAGKYAVFAIDPSNHVSYDYTHTLNQTQWQDLEIWVYETDRTDLSWLGGDVYSTGTQYLMYDVDNDGNDANDRVAKIGDLLDITILPPTAAELAGGLPGVGGGAPDELSTNAAYGFNLIFGDTGNNFSGNTSPFIINDDPALSYVPEPTSLALLGLGGLIAMRRRRAGH